VRHNKTGRPMTAWGQKPPLGHVGSNVRFARKQTRLERFESNARLAIGGPHAGAEAGNQATLFNFEVTYEE
jgi:hypothetical protein